MSDTVSRRMCVAGLLLILPIAMASAGQGIDDGGILSIESALRQGQNARALELVQAQLRQTPHQVKLLTLEGIAYSAEGRDLEALSAFRAALTIAPDSLAALEGAAQLEFNAGDPGAEALLQHIVRLTPEEPTSHAMLAAIAYRRNDCRTAIQNFDKSWAVIAQETTALTEFGACLLDQDDPGKAVEVLQRALATKPDDAYLRYNLAVAQQAADQNQDAIATLKPLLESSQPSANVLDVAAAAYEGTGDTPEAVRLLRLALISNPKELKYYLDFTSLALKHSSWGVGLDVVDVGLKQLPDAAPLYVARGILKVQLSQFDEAAADFETANRLDPTQTSGAIGAGMTEMQQHDPERALATVEAQLKTHPGDSFLQFIKASALLQSAPQPGSPRFLEAMEAARRSISANPSFVLARDLLAGMYLDAGDFSEAEEQSRMVLAQNQADEKAVYHLIQALRKQGKDPHNEIPVLTKRMSQLLDKTRNTEGAENRYRLYEPDANGALRSPQTH